MRNEADQEAAIVAAKATAPRITAADVDAEIAEVEYLVSKHLMTICVITMQNGFSLVGTSAAASPENYRKQIGEDISREKAREQIWSYLGFRLRDQIVAAATLAKFEDAVKDVPGFDLVEHIAMVAHEVNRGYCASLGDNTQPTWEEAPEWQKTSARKGVEFHLANPDATPAASHESWLAEKTRDGWSYGSVKDPVAKTHPCFVPYDGLPLEQRSKDYLFKAVIEALR